MPNERTRVLLRCNTCHDSGFELRTFTPNQADTHREKFGHADFRGVAVQKRGYSGDERRRRRAEHVDPPRISDLDYKLNRLLNGADE
jgi:hypothetical protein